MKPGIGGLPEGLDEEGDELVRSAEAALFHAMGAAALHPRSPVAEITLARIALVLAAPEVGHFRREGYGAVLGEADVRRLFRAALVECAERIQRPMDQVDQGVFGSFLYLVRSAGELNLDERAVSEMGFSSARDKFPAESVNWWILEASRRSALGDGEELAVALSRALKILVGQIDIAARDGAEGVSTELHQFFSLRAQAMSARLSRSVQPLIEKLYQTTRVSARSPKQDPIQSWAQLEVISAIQLASDQRAFEEWQNFEGLKKSIERASSLPTVINPAVLAWAERVLDGVWPF